MQRIALERARTFAIVIVVAAAVLLVGDLVLLFSGRGNLPFQIAQLVLVALFLVLGVRRLAVSRQALRKFEEENGPGAGEQKRPL
jgi:hypothetical protein